MPLASEAGLLMRRDVISPVMAPFAELLPREVCQASPVMVLRSLIREGKCQDSSAFLVGFLFSCVCCYLYPLLRVTLKTVFIGDSKMLNTIFSIVVFYSVSHLVG